jgi:hypothetical protein
MFLKKILIFIILLFAIGLQSSTGQVENVGLNAADRAFEQKKYAEAFELYENILTTKKQYSESMLLKMAFIKEKANDVPAALYYLHIHYNRNTDEKVLQKIIDIAENNKYKGHKPSDIQYLFFIFNQYILIIISLMLLLIVGLGTFLFMRHRKGLDILFPTILLAFIALFFLYLYDFGKPAASAIIKTNKAIAMDLPSAGASQVDMIEKGTCVQILAKEDIWFKILYEDKIMYLRENNMWIIK